MATLTPNYKFHAPQSSDNALEAMVTNLGADMTLADAIIKNEAYVAAEAKASLVRNAIPSGIEYLDTAWSATTAKSLTTAENRASLVSSLYSTSVMNAFQLKNFVAFMNGYEVQVRKDADLALEILLNAPPTVSGAAERNDLVFLEAWFVDKAVGDNIYKYGKAGGTVDHVATVPERVLEWRIRVVDGVDFATYPEGVNSAAIKAWGSTASDSAVSFTADSVDKGLYVATGVTGRSADLKVYAIPLFKVKRRNNAGYSAANPCGARDYINLGQIKLRGAQSLSDGSTGTAYIASTTGLLVGDIIKFISGSVEFVLGTVASIINYTDFTFVNKQYMGSYSADTVLASTSYLYSRPDGLYANVIDQSDITPLCHEVSLTGFNFNQKQNVAQNLLFTNGLTTKDGKKMLKTYHGVPKSVIDEYTACYFSGESLVAEKGTLLTNISSEIHKPCATGNGIYLADGKSIKTSVFAGQSAITAEAWYNTDDLWINASNYKAIIGFSTISGQLNVFLHKTSNANEFRAFIGSTGATFIITKPITPLSHIRLVLIGTSLKIFLNGVLIRTEMVNTGYGSTAVIAAVAGLSFTGYTYIGTVSDFHVSLTDRGTAYPQFEGGVFPADISQGYARVVPAFSNQRTQYADPLTGQYTNSVAKADDIDHDLGISRGTVGVGAKQVETATVVGTVTTPGNAVVTVTSANMGGSPKAVNVPLLKNELVYDKTTYAEWSKSTGVVGDNTGLEFTMDGAGYKTATIITNVKTSTKYGILLCVVNNTLSTSGLSIRNYWSGGYPTICASGVMGNQKLIIITSTTITENKLGLQNSLFDTLGNKIKIKDIRLFELPTGSEIEADFTNKTADELAVLYPFTQPNASGVADSIRQALALDQDIKSNFDISGTGADVILTNKARWGNDATLNIAIANGTCVGLTDAPTSVDTTAGVAGVWSASDTVKVKGAVGEIISGVIDTDTALANILSVSADRLTLYLDDLSKISVNDAVNITTDNGLIGWTGRVISSIDSTVKSILLSVALGAGNAISVVETTASSSVPVVKANIAGVATTINGTWTNLGTNEATFTLGTNATLTNQDLYIEYSLNCYAGQGAVTEVATEILQAEVKGKKLVPFVSGTTPFIRDDFANKVSGSVVECPHISKTDWVDNSLQAPSSGNFYENSDAQYTDLKTLNGVSRTLTVSSNNYYTQQLFSFNLLRLVEDKYGQIPAVDKVQWLKDNISKITCNWWGYGSCPVAGVAGNKVYLKLWNGTSWVANNNHSGVTVTKLADNETSGISSYIDSSGFAHYLAYTDAADGTTSATTIKATAHGLAVNDLVANVTHAGLSAVLTVGDANHITTGTIAGQVVGDIIQKYQKQTNDSVDSVTDGTTFVMAGHGLSTGDYIQNFTRSLPVKKITVDGDNIIIDDTTGFVAGDIIYIWKYLADDTCEAGIASTIYTDYCNIEVELKTSHLTALGYEVLVPDNPRRDDWIVVTDDFAGKVAGSLVGVSHVMRNGHASALPIPGSGTECSQADYANVSTLNGVCSSMTTSVAGEIPYITKSFDVIREYEDQYGPIPKTTRKLKAQWLRDNCYRVKHLCVLYGSCPSGNKAYFSWVEVDGGNWSNATNWGLNTGFTTSNSPFTLSLTHKAIIDNQGYAHFIAYTDASDGVTPSTIYTDYIKLTLYMKPRINPIIVRKDTKEIQTYFPAKTGKAVSWINYIPYQGLTPTSTFFFTNDPIVSDIQAFMSTIGTGAWTNTPYGLYKGLSSRLPIQTGKDYDLIGQDITVNSLLSKLLKVDLTSQLSGTTEIGELLSLSTYTSLIYCNRGENPAYFIRPIGGSYFAAAIYRKPLTGVSCNGKTQNILAFLVFRKADSKVYLVVNTNTSYSDNALFTLSGSNGNSSCDIYELPGRPLMKG